MGWVGISLQAKLSLLIVTLGSWVLFTHAGTLPDLGKLSIPGIRNFQRIDLSPKLMLSQLSQMDKLYNGSIVLDIGHGFRWELDLERVMVHSAGFAVRLITAKGMQTVAPASDLTFRGRIRGKPNSNVRLSVRDGRILGFFDAGEGDRTFVEPMDFIDRRLPIQAHAIYKQSDLDIPKGAGCGNQGPLEKLLLPAHLGQSLLPKTSGASSALNVSVENCALVEVAVAAEYSMFKAYGSAAAVEKRITDIMNMVEGLYEDPRINIHIKVSEMIIETEPKLTWGQMEIYSYLKNLTAWDNGSTGFKNPFDVSDLWYYDPLVTTSTTGLANVGTVCNKASGGHVIRDFTKTAAYLMINQAHELGHNFGANHVDNEKSILNPMILGTNIAWDNITIAAITEHKHSRVCLSSCNQGPTADYAVSAPALCSETRTFSDRSKGEPTAWTWKFGDGKTSSVQNPTHIYAAPGEYFPELTAMNGVGTDTISHGSITVKAYSAPVASGARGCGPTAITLKAAGTGTLKWYDASIGGTKLAEGPTFLTPALSASKTYYVEDGDPEKPVLKLGPLVNTIGDGIYFVSNSDRKLYFDVNRAAVLKTVKVYAKTAGSRSIEVLDQNDERVAIRNVEIPVGESRISLGIELDPGHDYSIKYTGNPDSLNLFRNSTGAAFPYRSKDSLMSITRSDVTTSDSASLSGYFYFFYDWEIQERVCASVRAPVVAEISCINGLALDANGLMAPHIQVMGSGRYRLVGAVRGSSRLDFHIRRLDGLEVRRENKWIPSGPYAIDLDLAGLGHPVYLIEIRQGNVRTMEKLIGF
jgi:PKD repeat protein